MPELSEKRGFLDLIPENFHRGNGLLLAMVPKKNVNNVKAEKDVSAFALPVVLPCIVQRRIAHPDFVLAVRGSVHAEHPPWGSRQVWVEQVGHPNPHKCLTWRKSDSGQLFCLSSWHKLSSAPFTSQDVETLQVICR